MPADIMVLTQHTAGNAAQCRSRAQADALLRTWLQLQLQPASCNGVDERDLTHAGTVCALHFDLLFGDVGASSVEIVQQFYVFSTGV